MPTTMAVIMIFATVKSCSSNWPSRTLYLPTPPFCSRKPNARPKRIAVTNFLPLDRSLRRLAGFLHCFAGIDHRTVKSSMAVAMPPMNMQMTVSHEPALS